LAALGVHQRGGVERFMGIDLSASPRRATSICVLTPRGSTSFHEAGLDDEIVEAALLHSPLCIAIDAPLSHSLVGRGFRACDREAMRLGLRLLPAVSGPMRVLAERGVSLAARLSDLGFTVLETFPRGAQRLLGLWGGAKRAADISRGLGRLGVKLPESSSLDMVDAATCAYVALLYTRGLCVALGDPSEGLLYLPARPTRLPAHRRSSYRSRRDSRLSRPS